MNSHTFTQEVIFHFTCASCANWWSYATTSIKLEFKKITCPHCGHTSKLTEKL